ncbi:hypothetical protein ABTP07_19690, partial [Acinetobacter baumannii]
RRQTLRAGMWTEADNERLREYIRKGASAVRADAAFNRPIVGVRNQARKLGLSFSDMRVTRKKWAESPSP